MLSFCTSSIACYQSKLWRKKKVTKILRGCLATFKDITLHAVKCKALKFTRLMLKKLGFFMSWVGRELIIVMLAQKKKKIHTHTSNSHQWRLSLYISSEEIFWFLGTVRSIKMWNKQTWKCYSVHWLLVFCLFEDIRHAFLLQTGWTSYNLSHIFFYVIAKAQI